MVKVERPFFSAKEDLQISSFIHCVQTVKNKKQQKTTKKHSKSIQKNVIFGKIFQNIHYYFFTLFEISVLAS